MRMLHIKYPFNTSLSSLTTSEEEPKQDKCYLTKKIQKIFDGTIGIKLMTKLELVVAETYYSILTSKLHHI
jgi:hypothetical protein